MVVEVNGKRLVIDPGSLVQPGGFTAENLLPVDGILITHEHGDHADPELLQALLAKARVPVIANQGTKNVLGDLVTHVVTDGEAFEVAGMQVVARELPHCLMLDGSAGPQNTGYVIDGAFFHPGDGTSLEGLHVPAAAVAIGAPDVSPKDVFDFIKQIGCQTIIPIHYSAFLVDPQRLGQIGKNTIPGVKWLVIDEGQTAEL